MPGALLRHENVYAGIHGQKRILGNLRHSAALRLFRTLHAIGRQLIQPLLPKLNLLLIVQRSGCP
jgi:hypothetical protein